MSKRQTKGEPIVRTSSRCAIYTRKSTEEGLDQEFNSLDAQREACAAYIVSQRHEGWTMVPNLYDDGGYSGGNMDRPGLRQLMADVTSGKVDVIVVYKVDRLTRALSDFVKIVDVLDASGASFVSITQSFNTTTSMGRLTLNVLLSFAQFEREVISERVRDKIAASKRKGMWMGGPIPLGYDVRDRKLIVNEREAETIRHILRRYLKLGSVRDLADALATEGIHSKLQIWSNGHSRGGRLLGRGALYHLLSNRLYRGEIVHRDAVYPGEHQAIVPEELWDAVQTMLAANGVERRNGANARDPSLLAGMIRDHHGRRMTPSHAAKGSRRYRYYVSVDEPATNMPASPQAYRVAAGDVEGAITAALRSLLDDKPALLAQLSGCDGDAEQTARLVEEVGALAASLRTRSVSAMRDLIASVDLKVVVEEDSIAATLSRQRLAKLCGLTDPVGGNEQDDRLPLAIASFYIRRGHELRLSVTPPGSTPVQRDGRLVALLLKAREARRLLLEPQVGDQPNYSDKHLARMARLAFLAPDIVASILDGNQPVTLTARRLLRAAEVPLAWSDQRRMFGFA